MIHAPYTPTDAAIAAYRAWSADRMFVPPPTLDQVRLVAEYCQEYIHQYSYPLVEMRELRRRVVLIRTATALANWLADCRYWTRLEPL